MKYLSLDGLKKLYKGIIEIIDKKIIKEKVIHKIPGSGDSSSYCYAHICDVEWTGSNYGYVMNIEYRTRYEPTSMLFFSIDYTSAGYSINPKNAGVNNLLDAYISLNENIASIYIKTSAWWNAIYITNCTDFDASYAKITWTSERVDKLPENAIKIPHRVSVYDIGSEFSIENHTLQPNITTNLLNPTLETTTIHGVKCTNNGDGTFTLSGKANAQAIFHICTSISVPKDAIVIGCKGGSQYKYGFGVFDGTTYFEVFDGETKEISAKTYSYAYIFIRDGVSVDNLLIKPMITTNLNATYDDFVPYTGNNGKLNKDVSDLLKRIEELEKKVNG